jgi:hypothetical protein
MLAAALFCRHFRRFLLTHRRYATPPPFSSPLIDISISRRHASPLILITARYYADDAVLIIFFQFHGCRQRRQALSYAWLMLAFIFPFRHFAIAISRCLPAAGITPYAMITPIRHIFAAAIFACHFVTLVPCHGY